MPTTPTVAAQRSPGRLHDRAVSYNHNCIALRLWQATWQGGFLPKKNLYRIAALPGFMTAFAVPLLVSHPVARPSTPTTSFRLSCAQWRCALGARGVMAVSRERVSSQELPAGAGASAGSRGAEHVLQAGAKGVKGLVSYSKPSPSSGLVLPQVLLYATVMYFERRISHLSWMLDTVLHDLQAQRM